MANTLHAPILLSRYFGWFCYQPVAGVGARITTTHRFVSAPDADPGQYIFTLNQPGPSRQVIMQIGVGGLITSVFVPSIIKPEDGGHSVGTPSGLGTYEVIQQRGYFGHWGYAPTFSMPPSAPQCIDGSPGPGWNQSTITDQILISPREIPIATLGGVIGGGGCLISPTQLTVQGYKGKGSYQADWVGGGIDPPGPRDGEVVFNYYPAKNGQPLIPENELPTLPFVFNNGGSAPVLICVNGVCNQVDPDDDPFEWDIPFNPFGPTPVITITRPDCPLCDPLIIDWPPYNPLDPDDPTNCTPAPGVICPVFTIYIPPFQTIPDPEPEPDPDPTTGFGNDGNFQGCVAIPCEIPYIYNYRAKP